MSRKLILLFIFVVFSDLTIAYNPFCSNDPHCVRRYGRKHTRCTYGVFLRLGPAKRCLAKGDMGGGLTDQEIKAIVSLHNEYRQKVAKGKEKRGKPGPQPAAVPGSMPNLEWSQFQANNAQRWVDQCDYNYSPCSDTQEYTVSENIGMSTESGGYKMNLIYDIVRGWFDELQSFDGKQAKMLDGKLATNYTNMMRAESTKIGCGARKYFEDGKERFFLDCNYGPADNFKTSPLYKVAE